MTTCGRSLALAAAIGLAAPVLAQRGRGRGGIDPRTMQQYFGASGDFYTPPDYHGNPPYDGRFTFARIKYRGYLKWSGREGPGWSHDYPDADVHLMRIMKDVTILRPFVESGPIVGGAIVALDDAELFKYPVSYLSEPGGWFPTEKEVEGMRHYLLKGGFVIFDDFRELPGWGADWTNLRTQMARVLPNARWIQLNGSEPIFDAFFKIDVKSIRAPYSAGYEMYFAIYQDNDPKKRIIALANVNNDVGEFWQWSAQGFYPVSLSNEAYKLGVNYLIYALTH